MFRTIDTAFWTDPKVRSLSSESKLLFLYAITNTHTHVSGIYYLPNVIVEHETGIPKTRIESLWDTLSIGYPELDGAGLVRRDSKSEVIWVVNMLRHQGRGDKILRGVANHLRTLHNCCLIKDFLRQYPSVKRHLKGYPIDRVSRVGQSCLKDQEQDQEQEKEELPAEPARDTATLEPHPRKRTPRDDLFDAVAEVAHADPRTSAPHIGRVVKFLLTAEPPYTPDEVRRLPDALSGSLPDGTPITLGVVQKYIAWVRDPPKKVVGGKTGIDALFSKITDH